LGVVNTISRKVPDRFSLNLTSDALIMGDNTEGHGRINVL